MTFDATTMSAGDNAAAAEAAEMSRRAVVNPASDPPKRCWAVGRKAGETSVNT